MKERLIVLLAVMLCALSAQALEYRTNEVDGVAMSYAVVNGCAVIRGAGVPIKPAIEQGTAGKLVIPEAFGDCVVTSVFSRAFYNCTNLTEIVIPKTVMTATGAAFSNCSSLERITMLEGANPKPAGTATGTTNCTVYVNEATTWSWGDTWCKLPVVHLGCQKWGHEEGEHEVVSEPAYCIEGTNAIFCARCHAQMGIELVPALVYEPVGDGRYRQQVDGITWYFTFRADGTVSLGGGGRVCFEGALPAEAAVPAVLADRPVTRINGNAFVLSNASVILPASIDTIRYDAFWCCQNLTIKFLGDEPVYEPDQWVSHDFHNTIRLLASKNASWTPTGFCLWHGASFHYYDDPEATPGGGYWSDPTGARWKFAYYGDGVQILGLESTTNQSVTIPSSVAATNVVSLGEGMLKNHSELTVVTLPRSPLAIPTYCFQGCGALRDIYFPDGMNRSCGYGAFFYTDGNQTIWVPYGVKWQGTDYMTNEFGLVYNTWNGKPLHHVGYDVCAHEEGEPEVFIAPTYHETGEARYYCRFCYELMRVSEIPKVICGHETTREQVVKSPGFATPGSKDVYCTICGDLLSTEVLPPLSEQQSSMPDGGPYADTLAGVTWSYTITNGEATVTGAAENGVSEVTVPSRLGGWPVAAIGGYVFYCHTVLTALTVPEGVRDVGLYCFVGCSNLKTLHLPSTLRRCQIVCDANNTALGEGFLVCDGVLVGARDPLPSGKVTMPEMWLVSEASLYMATEVTEFIFLEGLLYLDHQAFRGAGNNASFEFPESLIEMSDGIFKYCSASELRFRGKPPEGLDIADIKTDQFIYYNKAYETVWLPVIETLGWTNAHPWEPDKPELTDEEISDWVAAQGEAFTTRFGSDATNAFTALTGKYSARGGALSVYHDYIAGTDPLDTNSVFNVDVSLTNGIPYITYTPDLGAARTYTTYGSKDLRIWAPVTNTVDTDCKFFKVEVSMP